MANKTLFASLRDALIPQTDTVNSENAPAYALAPKQALAQYAATGCFGRTFYATADEQLTRVLELCEALDPGVRRAGGDLQPDAVLHEGHAGVAVRVAVGARRRGCTKPCSRA